MRARTYTTLDGEVLDLGGLTPAEEAFLDVALAKYRDRVPYAQFAAFVYSTANPLLETTGGRVTPEVYRHPLFRALRDLEDRLGILQGEIGAAPGDLPDVDPVADEWIPVSIAARVKGVTVAGLHAAIRRGDVIARPAKEAGRRLLVSRRSLEGYTPSAHRQQAGRLAHVHE